MNYDYFWNYEKYHPYLQIIKKKPKTPEREERTMTPQEIEDKKAIIAAVNKAFRSEARAAGISNQLIGRVISFLISAGREAWPYLRDTLDDLINPPADDAPIPEPEPTPEPEPKPEEPATPEDSPSTPESPK